MPSSCSRGAAGGGDAEAAELRVARVAFVKAQLPRVQDLRKELRLRSMSTDGGKAELIARLVDESDMGPQACAVRAGPPGSGRGQKRPLGGSGQPRPASRGLTKEAEALRKGCQVIAELKPYARAKYNIPTATKTTEMLEILARRGVTVSSVKRWAADRAAATAAAAAAKDAAAAAGHPARPAAAAAAAAAGGARCTALACTNRDGLPLAHGFISGRGSGQRAAAVVRMRKLATTGEQVLRCQNCVWTCCRCMCSEEGGVCDRHGPAGKDRIAGFTAAHLPSAALQDRLKTALPGPESCKVQRCGCCNEGRANEYRNRQPAGSITLENRPKAAFRRIVVPASCLADRMSDPPSNRSAMAHWTSTCCSGLLRDRIERVAVCASKMRARGQTLPPGWRKAHMRLLGIRPLCPDLMKGLEELALRRKAARESED